MLGVKLLRRFGSERAASFAGALMQTIGPWLPEHRVGRDNLTATYPERSPAEIEQILKGVWNNYGRVCVVAP
jgi:KDO2-lipid IV(A) lauroyltransferase